MFTVANAMFTCGQDMFGITALMKFAAWDKTDLLELLLPVAQNDNTYFNLASPTDGFTALHHAADMGARRAFAFLAATAGVDDAVLDKRGRKAAELAAWLQ